MRIVAVTFGSRGDIEPFVTLGVGLAAAGHDVSIVSHGAVESQVVDAGLQFAEVSGPSFRDVLESPEALELQRGWAGLGQGAESDDVHVIGDGSYGSLFDHVASVVHHGGAGTTALGLRHGCPTAVLPAVADQFFWGHRVAALRVGPEPRPLRRVTRRELRRRFGALLSDSSFRTRGREIASRLRDEDGVECAVATIERSVAGHAGRRTRAQLAPYRRYTSRTPSA